MPEAVRDLAIQLADTLNRSGASHDDKFTALTAVIAALGVPR